MQVIYLLAAAWFLGAVGLLVGAVVGARSHGSVLRAFMFGGLLGAVAGGVLSLEFIREVADSTSSTASIGLLLVPFPPITNGVAGGIAAVILRGWKVGRTPA
jgi:hypothetical protein